MTHLFSFIMCLVIGTYATNVLGNHLISNPYQIISLRNSRYQYQIEERLCWLKIALEHPFSIDEMINAGSLLKTYWNSLPFKLDKKAQLSIILQDLLFDELDTLFDKNYVKIDRKKYIGIFDGIDEKIRCYLGKNIEDIKPEEFW